MTAQLDDSNRIPCPDGIEGCSVMHYAPNTDSKNTGKLVPIYLTKVQTLGDGAIEVLTMHPTEKWVSGYRGGGWYETQEPIGYLNLMQENI